MTASSAGRSVERPGHWSALNSDSVDIAYHEAGHLVAAVLRDVDWTFATIVPTADQRSAGLDGFVKFRSDGPFQNPDNRAFIMFAGPYAEARFTGAPLDKVCASHSAQDDRPHFLKYRSPHQDALWGEELDSVWRTIEECADRLLLSGSIRPDHPDPLKDRAKIREFLAALGICDAKAKTSGPGGS